MRTSLVGIPLILIYAALMLSCESDGQNADQAKFHEIEKMWEAMPIYPGLVEVNNSRSSSNRKAHIAKNFKLAGRFEDVRRFYVESLTQQGWQPVNEKKIRDWGRDFGGQSLSFSKNDYNLNIEYAGEGANKGWDYGIGIYWREL